MRRTLLSIMLIVGAASCAEDEAYLVLDVAYADRQLGKFGFVQIRRINGPPLLDGPHTVAQDSRYRRIAVHARGSELDAQLELKLRVCDDREGLECQSSTLQISGAFEAGKSRQLCIDLGVLQLGQIPTFDLDGALPGGLMLDCG